jgi:hypothetical protein
MNIQTFLFISSLIDFSFGWVRGKVSHMHFAKLNTKEADTKWAVIESVSQWN